MSFDRRRDTHLCPLSRTLLLACAALAGPLPALSQTSASLTLASAYTARGIALSSHPVAQLHLDHDADDGWYAGVFASPVTLGSGRGQAELIVYGGRSHQLASGLSWDAGITRTAFLRDARYDYHELYLGLALDHASARVSMSPAYYGEGRSVYLDLNGFHPFSDRLRLTAHAGLLHAFDDYHRGARDRADLRLGVALDLRRWSVQAGLETLLRGSGGGPARARLLSASATLGF